MRIQAHSASRHSRTDVSGVFCVNSSVRAELSRVSLSCKVEMRNALWGESVAGDWLEESKIDFAIDGSLPTGMTEIGELARNI